MAHVVDRHGAVEQISSAVKTNGSLLLVGPAHCAKTSVAFSAALRAVETPSCSGQASHAWFICQRNKMEKNLPISIIPANNLPPDDPLDWTDPRMERIHMKYMNGLSDLRHWCVRVHQIQTTTLPQFLVVDDLDLFFENDFVGPSVNLDVPGAQKALLQVTSLLRHAVEYFSSAPAASCSLIVIVSSDRKWFKDLRSMIERQMACTLVIRREGDDILVAQTDRDV